MAALAGGDVAWAQGGQAERGAASAPPGVSAYPGPFFAEFSPENALQMIERTPGFTFERGGEDDVTAPGGKRRANVLINGQPPTGSDPVDVILRRIPASAVERIEVLREATANDMMGYNIVANVVRRAPGPEVAEVAKPNTKPAPRVWRSSVTASSTAVRDGQASGQTSGHVGGSLAADAQRRRDGVTIDAALVASQTPSRGGGGRRTRTSRISGAVTTTDFDAYTVNTRGEVRGGLDRPVGGGRLRLNGVVSLTDADLRTIETPHGGTRTERHNFTGRDRSEATVRYSRRVFGKRQLEMRLSQQQTQTDVESISNSGATTFRSDRLSGSTTASASMRFFPSKTVEWELGSQGDRRFQEGTSTFSGAEAAHRDTAEAYLTTDWKARDTVAVAAGLWARHISVGDDNAETSFSYLSPRLSGTWSLDKQSQVILSIQQSVLPINLDNLAVNLRRRLEIENEEEIIEGAAQLAPETTLSSRLRVERKFGRGLVFVEFNHQERANIVELAPLANGGEAYDNIGDGVRQSVVVSVDTPMPALGLPDVTVRVRATLRSSSLTDPFTGEVRRQSGERPVEWELGLRQDLKAMNLRWGVDAVGLGDTRYWRRSEISQTGLDPTVMVYVEHAHEPGLVLRAEVRNLGDQEQRTRRQIYQGGRDAGLVIAAEDRATRSGPIFYVSARRTY